MKGKKFINILLRFKYKNYIRRFFMSKYFLLSMLLLIVCCLTSCNYVTNRAECLNLEDFNNFYYN